MRAPDFALADLFRAHANGSPEKKHAGTLAAYVFADEPGAPSPRKAPPCAGGGLRKPTFSPFGGMLESLRTDSGAVVPLTFVPPFPVYPPETAWMREPRTDIPALVLSTHSAGARVAYLPADIDRRFAAENLPDHGNLLANLFRWAAGGKIPLQVEGAGLLDCHLYQQPGRLILHLVNLTNQGAWRAPLDELIPVGPLKVRVLLPAGVRGSVRCLVAGGTPTAATAGGWCSFTLPRVLDHEVAIIGG